MVRHRLTTLNKFVILLIISDKEIGQLDANEVELLFMIYKLVNNTYRFFYHLNLLQNLLNINDDRNQMKGCHCLL